MCYTLSIMKFILIMEFCVVKHILLSILLFCLTGCRVEKSVELTDGTCITEREYHRILKKVYRQTLRTMSKEEKRIIRSFEIEVENKE